MRPERVLRYAAIGVVTVAVVGCTKVRPEPQEPISLASGRPSLTAQVIAPPEEGSSTTAGQPASSSEAAPAADSTEAAASEETGPTALAVSESTEPAPTPLPTPVPQPQHRTHLVGWGDTLLSIALQYGVPMDAIVEANELANNVIYVGQTLKIPVQSVPPGAQHYVVQPGDTLFGIAARLGVQLEDLMRANNLTNGYYLQVGQILVVPGTSVALAQGGGGQSVQAASVETRVHTVQAGDTVWSIAALYQVQPYDLAVANSLGNPHLLQVGQKLIIP